MRSRAGRRHRARGHAAWATRVVASREVEARDAELGGAAYTMALRQRRHAYFSAHDWCVTKSRPSPSEAWSKGFEAVLLSLQPSFASCVVAAQQRLAFVSLPDEKLTLHWKAVIDPSGHPHEVAQVDFPSTLRADAGLCILDVIASASFPAPGREVAVGSDVTFAHHD